MAEIELRKLRVDDGNEIYQMLQEIPEEENGFINPVHGKSPDEYAGWLKCCAEDAERTEIVDGWKVPETVYWMFADGNPVGFGKIRHFLTDRLLADGGTIGYAIRPSERNKGYGNRLLGELVKACAGLGIDQALLTIHRGNSPSVKAALRNGGVIERSGDDRHYIWIKCR